MIDFMSNLSPNESQLSLDDKSKLSAGTSAESNDTIPDSKQSPRPSHIPKVEEHTSTCGRSIAVYLGTKCTLPMWANYIILIHPVT